MLAVPILILAASVAPLLAHAAPTDPEACVDERCGSVAGVLRRAGDRRPLGQTTILVIPDAGRKRVGHVAKPGQGLNADPPWIRREQTDDAGSFTFLNVPIGTVRLVVVAEGLRRTEYIARVTTGTTTSVKLFAEPSEESSYLTRVEASRSEREQNVSPRVLTREEIYTIPGAQGDALRSLQSFPGVSRTPGGLGFLVIRGAPPTQSAVFVGEHPVPRGFHASAINSILPAESIEELKFLPGNFSARYGNATAGLVVIDPRVGRTDGVHGFAKLDIAGVGGLVEGPVGRGSYILSARRGYADAVFALVRRVDENARTVVPSEYDYQAAIDHPIGDSRLRVRVLGVGDRLRRQTLDPFRDETTVTYDLRSSFHRADFELRRTEARWGFLLSPYFLFEDSGVTRPFQTDRRFDFVTGWRAEARAKLSRGASILLGTDAKIDPFYVRQGRPDGLGQLSEERSDSLLTTIGAYAEAQLERGPVSVWPGVRLSAYTQAGDAEASVDPRLSAQWRITERWRWKAGIGSYSQAVQRTDDASGNLITSLGGGIGSAVVVPGAVQALEPSIAIRPATDDLHVAQAVQASTSFAFSPTPTWSLEAGAFVRYRDNADAWPQTQVGRVVRWDRASASRAYGLEFMARRRLARRFYGWVSYTLSRAHRINRERGRTTADDFDQPHNLALVASYELPRRWRIGARFRVVSGTAFRPVVAVIATPSDSTEGISPLRGETNSERFPTFHQFDLRIDKRWVAKRAAVMVYVDVQNVYNHQNVEVLIYTSDFSEQVSSYGLPIFPTLGLRVEY